jgi:hypothetical protein
VKEQEQWRPVAGYEGAYEVSSLGRVKSLARIDCRGHRVKQRILRQSASPAGYTGVWLQVDGVRQYVKTHNLVAEAWVPGRDALHRCVHHVDRDRSNNAASNLRWVTPSENNLISAANGQPLIGSQRPTAKLCEEDILPICELYDWGDTIKDIAEMYGVSANVIGTVVRGKSWRHIPREPRPGRKRSTPCRWAPAAKLRPDDVREIRRRYAAGESCGQIAEDYPVDPSSIAAAATRRTWRSIP